MQNLALAKILRDIGFLTEVEDGDNAAFKARAYYRAADIIANLNRKVDDIYREKGLQGLLEIPTVGKAIALKVQEYITTGRVAHLEEMKARTPINTEELSGIEGIGPRTIKILYDRLGIKNLDDLYNAAAQKKIRTIPGFSEKKEQDILKRIDFFRKGKGRRILGEIYPLVKQIESRLSRADGVKKVAVAGSIRRMRETIGDIDYIVLSDRPEEVMDFFVRMPEVAEVLGRGPAKVFVKLNAGIDADLLVVPNESFGSAMQYFTGSKEHSVELRRIAISKGLRLNEWGLFKSDKEDRTAEGASDSSELTSGKKVMAGQVAGNSEEEIYSALGLQWIPPEMRENRGEIELARAGQIPKLVEYGSLKGDLQVHSDSTDGTMPIEDMAHAAKEKFGLDYIAITDHTKSLTIAGGLDEKELLDQAHRIAEINDRLEGFRILSGAEVNIMKDGSLDIPDNVLDKLDIVGAAIHSHFSQPVEVQTERLVRAAQNPSVDIIFHPTGRLLNKRDGYPVDIARLVEAAKDTGTALEIDAHYDRLDLRDDHVRMAVQHGVKLVIDSDAHHPVHFAFLMFGLGQARRGWARESDVLNTMPFDRLKRSLK